jgi:predicted nuclease of restriction endonuclease-like (RecB) superfamily
MLNNTDSQNNFIQEAMALLRDAKNKVVSHINLTMVNTYYDLGRMIVEEEQKGKERASYGSQLLAKLSDALTVEFGKGFSVTNLRQMRVFYLQYQKQQTLSANFTLSWSHYLKLMRIEDENKRSFYEIESKKNNWSIRELQRQLDAGLYTRLILSRNKEQIKQLSKEGLVIESAKDVIKDPYILEFIGLPQHSAYTENEIEQAIIDKLESFLMELGTGFTFVARQKRISFEDKHFYIDLVFFNRILKSFVLIDLKIGELKHQDIGQMQMYVNFFDREVKLKDENPTIGLILCQNKSEALVRYTLPEDNDQIFASKYKTVLPSKSTLKALLDLKNQ